MFKVEFQTNVVLDFEGDYMKRLIYKSYPNNYYGFVRGFTRAIDIGATLNKNDTYFIDDADCAAIKSDWYVVGDDLKNALKQYENAKI